jgi:glycosyltransferase involved in cell wall biosynthesis
MTGTAAPVAPDSESASLDLTIAIPCLNEERFVAATLDAVVSAMRELSLSYEIIVIDDGSTDRTADVVESYRLEHPGLPVRVHRNRQNRGLNCCYVDGAFLGQGRYYRMVCGDNVEPKETFVAIFRELGKADLIIPYHERLPGKSPFRLALSRSYTFLVNQLSGYRIRYYNGMALTSRYNVMRWGPHSFGFGFQAELITRLLDEGASFIQIPVAASHQPKSGKNSAVNLRNFVSVAHTLSEILLRRVRRSTFGR